MSTPQERDGLVEVVTLIPDVILDLRYATADNFTGERLYPAGARCFVHGSIAPGLVTAATVLREQGLRLVVWDGYRPHDVQVRMWQVVADPDFVARPTQFARSHEAGLSVDVTAARPDGTLLDMGTGFDSFTPQAAAYATDGVSPTAQRHRALLRAAMHAGGLDVYDGEWWHFDGPGAGEPRPLLTAPLL